jgi:hypothetical protein
MHSSKLLQLYSSLTKKEMKDFLLYLNADFFNKNEQLRQLATYISKHADDLSSVSLSKEKTFKSLFPNDAFEETKMRYLMSDLTKLLENFLTFIAFDEDDFQKKLMLSKSLYKRNQEKYFLNALEELNKSNKKDGLRDSNFFFNQYLIEEITYNHTSEKRNRSIDSSLQEVIDNLETAYLSKSIKYYCEMLNRSNILQVKYNLSFFDEMMKFLVKGSFDDIPAIKIYLCIYETLKELDNQENYIELLRLIDVNGQYFTNKELRDMYVFAQNYCIKRINKGLPKALEQIYDLYKIMDSKDLFYEGNYTSQPDFKNIVTTALRLGEVDWTIDFVEKHKETLNPEFKENAFTYSMAWIEFSQKKYKEALRLLLRVEFNDVYYHLDSKSLLLKTYFEMDETESLLSLFDAFKIYLKRNKFISEFQRETYQNFVNVASKLLKVKLGKIKMTEELRSEILNTSPLADLSWIKIKIDELSR